MPTLNPHPEPDGWKRYYDKIRRQAAFVLGSQRADLTRTDLAHEYTLRRLRNGRSIDTELIETPGHLRRGLEQTLIDWRRRGNRKKRGGHLRRSPLEDIDQARPDDVAFGIRCAEIVSRLERLEPLHAKIIRLGLHHRTPSETATELGLEPEVLKREARMARRQFRKFLSEED